MASVDGDNNHAFFTLSQDFKSASEAGYSSTFIAKNPDVLRVRKSGTNETIFHYCALKNRYQCVKDLAAAGADPNCRDSFDSTPLLRCISLGRREMVSLLLELGADLDAKDKDGRGALHQWLRQYDERLLGLLIRAGADVHSLNSLGETPLSVVESRLERTGPHRYMSVTRIRRLPVEEQKSERQKRIKAEIVWETRQRKEPDHQNARKLLLAAGADPDNLGWGHVEAW